MFIKFYFFKNDDLFIHFLAFFFWLFLLLWLILSFLFGFFVLLLQSFFAFFVTLFFFFSFSPIFFVSSWLCCMLGLSSKCFFVSFNIFKLLALRDEISAEGTGRTMLFFSAVIWYTDMAALKRKKIESDVTIVKILEKNLLIIYRSTRKQLDTKTYSFWQLNWNKITQTTDLVEGYLKIKLKA